MKLYLKLMKDFVTLVLILKTTAAVAIFIIQYLALMHFLELSSLRPNPALPFLETLWTCRLFLNYDDLIYLCN